MLKPNSQVTTNLIKARELIADEKNWCQGGNREKRRCALEALWPDWTDAEGPELDLLYRAALEIAPDVPEWFVGNDEPSNRVYFVNDSLGHSATIAMFSRAIELSLQDGETRE